MHFRVASNCSMSCHKLNLPCLLGMQALEEDEEQADHPEIEVEKPNVGDLRELLARRDEPTALFSAAAAGFIPLDDDDDDELGDADADEGDGAVNGEGDDAIVEGDGAAELGGDGGGC